MPSTEKTVVGKLEESITIEELNAAMTSLQSGKSPGPDGYPSEFYKKFWHKLDMFNNSFNSLEKRQKPISL